VQFQELNMKIFLQSLTRPYPSGRDTPSPRPTPSWPSPPRPPFPEILDPPLKLGPCISRIVTQNTLKCAISRAKFPFFSTAPPQTLPPVGEGHSPRQPTTQLVATGLRVINLRSSPQPDHGTVKRYIHLM